MTQRQSPSDDDRYPATESSSQDRPYAALFITALALLVVGYLTWRFVSGAPHQTIGVEGKKVIEVAGPQLYAAPFTPGDAISLRIAESQSTKAGFRYDLRFIAYGPGKFDLGKYLVLAGNQPSENVPKLIISVNSVLPKNHQGELFETTTADVDLQSFYGVWMTLSWLLWGLLLIPLLLLGRAHHARAIPAVPAPTLEERLQQMLRQASKIPLDDVQQADLERLLVGYWLQRLNLFDVRLSAALAQLKRHPIAGRQISLVERWLHGRNKSENGSVAKALLQELNPEMHQRVGQSNEVARS